MQTAHQAWIFGVHQPQSTCVMMYSNRSMNRERGRQLAAAGNSRAAQDMFVRALEATPEMARTLIEVCKQQIIHKHDSTKHHVDDNVLWRSQAAAWCSLCRNLLTGSRHGAYSCKYPQCGYRGVLIKDVYICIATVC
jgi:hypothetical protein